MIFQNIFDDYIFNWVVLPILIFVSRIFDVSLGTLRIIFVSRSKKFLAPLLGFFEILIWLLAISQIMKNLNNIACFIAYALGFSMGTFIGIVLEEKLAIGTLIVRIALAKDDCRMKERLYEAGFGVTSLDAKGMNGNVKLIYTIVKRKDLEKVIAIIKKCKSNAFYYIEDAKAVEKGIFPKTRKGSPILGKLNPFSHKYKSIFSKHEK